MRVDFTCRCKKLEFTIQTVSIADMRRLMITIGIILLVGFLNAEAKRPKQVPPSITTNFEKGITLTAKELRDVIQLGRQCGISNAVEVSTFHYLPSGGRGISIRGCDRVQGRDTYHDELNLSREGWDSLEVGKNIRRRGRFFADPTLKQTIHLRDFEIRGRKLRIIIGDGVDVALADVVIGKIVSRNVEFTNNNDWSRDEFKRTDVSQPKSISLGHSFGEYQLRFENRGMYAVIFKVEKGKVIITGIAHINV